MNEIDTMMIKIGSHLMSTIESNKLMGYNKHKMIMEDIQDDVKVQINQIIGDVTKLPLDDLITLGFQRWDLEDETELYLAPLWIYDLIPYGTEMVTIDGDIVVKSKNLTDLDTRMQTLAYGFDKTMYGKN